MRFGSADSVVLPVPDNPKKTAVSLVSGSMFAEQCIGSVPSSGSTKFIVENTDFLISPAYRLPATMIVCAS